jgi:pimeloyl-ACP methyl ester carboxylesterase
MKIRTLKSYSTARPKESSPALASVAEVADQLGIERFVVEGMSAGGPYALACG